MRLVNRNSDFHLHTMNYSDGMNTVEELVQYAGRVGLEAIAITDHSDANMLAWKQPIANGRFPVKRWRNVHNEVKVVFGVEADLLNVQGDIADTIAGLRNEFMVLSAHPETYDGSPRMITDAYLHAIERHYPRINVLGHLDAKYFGDHVDMRMVVGAANEHGIIIELNAKNLFDNRNVPEQTRIMLEYADRVMVNSDAHCLADFDNRERAFQYLKDNGYLNKDDNY